MTVSAAALGVLGSPDPSAAGPAANTQHLDNPFNGAKLYRNVDYVAAVRAAANRESGRLRRQMLQVADCPTFVWLDTIAAVRGTDGYRGLAGHLDLALEQRATAIGLVLYNLPNRDGAALASNGELLVARRGLERYKAEYIDAIYDVIRQPKYATLRIVFVVEPDSLANLVTNLRFPMVKEAHESGAYVQGVQYAIGKLRSLPNTYAYIDIAHAGWMGWANNLTAFADLLKSVGSGIPGGGGLVDGFVSNVANYNVFEEPFLRADQTVAGRPVRSVVGWYDWADYIDERSYATAIRNELTRGPNAYPERVGLLLDTSRNGWGGPSRPTGPSSAADLGAFVRGSSLDRRLHKGNWANQVGAGLGERPTSNPAPYYHAFVWVKPPGESDGSSSLVPVGSDNPTGKKFDPMCDPDFHGNSHNGYRLTGAMPGAPVAGQWFQAHFAELVRNAYPPIEAEDEQVSRGK